MRKLFLIFSVLVLAVGCTPNAVTGRKQLALINEGQLQQMALQEYKTFLSQNKVMSNSVSKDAEMVKRVGNRIANAISKYYQEQGKGEVLNGYQWEFNLVDSKDINAWCMPGGKVVVYTGLLPVTQNEAALAVVMGHEIAHAVAQHGNERMSQAMIAQGISLAGNIITSGNSETNTIFNNIYGPGATLGVLLPNSRKQELEADKFGLIFSALSGYNPQEAIPFWQRMAKAGSGQKPPEFLSTHPSDETRIQRLQELMPEVLKYYKPIGK
ncbi:MAG TPA: M48 family metallopeptidase [Chitinophagaceae bacterium]|nr:M48 family metallopeptidase [Chitinophagaceae bacterium]